MINIICGPSTDGCLFTVNSKCVIYDGPSTTNVGYVPNMDLTDLLLLIDSKLAPSAGDTHLTSSQSINVAGNGSLASPYLPTVKLATDVGNSIELRATGLYMPPFEGVAQFTNSFFDI